MDLGWVLRWKAENEYDSKYIIKNSQRTENVVLYKIRLEKVGEENVWETSQIPLKNKWL